MAEGVEGRVMAEGDLVFRSEWIVQINEMLDNHGKSSRAKEDAILRVATPLRKTKPEAYTPQFLSIGPYHHSKLGKDIHDYSSRAGRKISRAETFKGKAAASLSQKLSERGKSFKSIIELMEQMQPEIESFYHLPNSLPNSSNTTKEEQSQNYVALMMAVDSFFLLQFLIRLYVSPEQETSSLLDDHKMKLGPLEVCIKSDILKLENQIPLTVLNGVFEYAKEASIYRGLPEDLNRLLHKTCAVLSSFKFEVSDDDHSKRNEATVENQPHLLAYMYAFVSPILQVKPEDQAADLCTRIKFHIMYIHVYILTIIFWKWNSPSFERKYEIALNAQKLAKNGIKFKSMSGSDRDKMMIRFDSWSGTLYLPRINVTEMQTEVLLRNMLAWEFNHVSLGTSVIDYIGLMQCLIQTPQDVRVLRDRRVIESTLTDESIAKMWNDLARPFFTGNLGPHSHDLARRLYFVLHKNFHVIKIRRMLGGLYDYVSNWKFIGFIAGFLGLALTATQTYFTVFPRDLFLPIGSL